MEFFQTVLFEGGEDIAGNPVCFPVSDYVPVKARHTGAGIPHSLDDISPGFYGISIEVFSMKGFQRGYGIATFGMTCCTVLLEQCFTATCSMPLTAAYDKNYGYTQHQNNL
jgi:hypothetical protein